MSNNSRFMGVLPIKWLGHYRKQAQAGIRSPIHSSPGSNVTEQGRFAVTVGTHQSISERHQAGVWWGLWSFLLKVVLTRAHYAGFFFSPLFWYNWLHAISEKLSFGKNSTEFWRCQSESYKSELSFTRFWVLELMNTSIFSRSQISLSSA